MSNLFCCSYIQFNLMSFLSAIFFLSLELETKRILLDIFKEKQKKSAEAGTIPSFYKKVSITLN